VPVLDLPREDEGVHWFPRVTVEKYSIDQTAYAERKWEAEASWGRRLLTRSGLMVPKRLHGDFLRELFDVPEDGYAHDEGNILVNAGLTNIINLLIGAAASGANSRPLGAGGGSGAAVVGVGSTATTATTADTALGANATTPNGTVGAWYQSMDASFPSLTTPATINGQSTFASGNANMAWNEWCWVTGAGTVTAGATLASVYGTASSQALLNHKAPVTLGTKASGASWVFSTTVVFS
jgi:hypothetical protein